MSGLTVLLLILLTEVVNKQNYAFLQRKDELHYTRDDFSPAFPCACVHYYEWWWSGRTVFSWNKKCSPLPQKIQTSLLCSKGGEDLQSLSWCSFDCSSRAPDCKMICMAASNSSCPISNCQFSV